MYDADEPQYPLGFVITNNWRRPSRTVVDRVISEKVLAWAGLYSDVNVRGKGGHVISQEQMPDKDEVVS